MTTPPSSMPPSLPALTLVVATTPSLGIGLRGTLPWPPLKTDVAFFARVTKRAPPTHPLPNGQRPPKKVKNAVVMGRKTWESIPLKFRPLKGRINVVVSRKPKELDLPFAEGSQEPVLGVGSIEEGLQKLQSTYPASEPQVEQQQRDGAYAQDGEETFELGRVFVIGGAEIYRHALQMPNCKRILWTRLKGEWECDTFFPEGVLRVGGAGDASGDGRKWVKRSIEEMEEWVGEDGVGGLKKEGEVEFEMSMLEREEV